MICKEAHGNVFLVLRNDHWQHCSFRRNRRIFHIDLSGGVYADIYVQNVYQLLRLNNSYFPNLAQHDHIYPPHQQDVKLFSVKRGREYTKRYHPHSNAKYKIGLHHNSDVIMATVTSQITSLTIVYSTVYSGADQRKHQSSASLAFVRGIHRWPVNSPHKGPVTRKMLPFDDVIMWMYSTNLVAISDWQFFLSLHNIPMTDTNFSFDGFYIVLQLSDFDQLILPKISYKLSSQFWYHGWMIHFQS